MVRHQQGLLLRDSDPARPTQKGLALPRATHTLARPRSQRPVLSALAVAGIPSHICTIRKKACNFHRIQFFESELQTTVCFIFLFNVIARHLVVGKARAIRKGRGWVNYLKKVQGRPMNHC